MTTSLVFSILSLILGTVCYVPYILSIVRGESKPHTVSWFVWALTTGLGFVVQLNENVGYGAWTLGLFCLINTGIFFYALKKGESSIDRIDIVSGILALVALGLWFWLGVDLPLWPVILISVADSLGFLPTFRKTYKDPDSESLWFWGLTITSLVFSFFAMDVYSFDAMLYPMTMVFWEICLVIIMIFSNRKS